MLEQHEHKHSTRDFDGIIENRDNSPPPYFTVLFYGLVLWGVAFCAYFLLGDWSSEAEFREKMATHEQTYQAAPAPPPEASPAPSAATADVPSSAADVDAAALYAARCAMCHGPGGKGGFAPDLTLAEYTYGKSPEAILESLRNGRPNGMPAFGNQLEERELNALVDFLLAL